MSFDTVYYVGELTVPQWWALLRLTRTTAPSVSRRAVREVWGVSYGTARHQLDKLTEHGLTLTIPRIGVVLNPENEDVTNRVVDEIHNRMFVAPPDPAPVSYVGAFVSRPPADRTFLTRVPETRELWALFALYLCETEYVTTNTMSDVWCVTQDRARESLNLLESFGMVDVKTVGRRKHYVKKPDVAFGVCRYVERVYHKFSIQPYESRLLDGEETYG